MDTLENHKILIIDDLADNLKVMVSIFEEYHPNYEVFQTSDSRNAIEIATKTLPNLIITDWKMPELSGIELTKQLKTEPKTQNIPVIITTAAMITPSDLQVALQAGAVDFVIKPFNNIELLARANSAILIANNYKISIENKNKELTENALQLVKNKEFASELNKLLIKLDSNIASEDLKSKQLIKKLSELINSKISDDSLERFNIAFYSIHENFNKNLTNKFPALTKSEIKLCALLKLGMSTKDIASILYQTNESIKVSRSRLRKKLGLDQSQNIHAYLSNF